MSFCCPCCRFSSPEHNYRHQGAGLQPWRPHPDLRPHPEPSHEPPLHLPRAQQQPGQQRGNSARRPGRWGAPAFRNAFQYQTETARQGLSGPAAAQQHYQPLPAFHQQPAAAYYSQLGLYEDPRSDHEDRHAAKRARGAVQRAMHDKLQGSASDCSGDGSADEEGSDEDYLSDEDTDR